MIERFRLLRRSWFARMATNFAVMFTALLVAILFGVYVMASRLAHQGAQEALDADLAAFDESYAQRLLPGLRQAVERRASDAATRNLYLLLGRSDEYLEGNIKSMPAGVGQGGDHVAFGKGPHYIGRIIQLRGGFRMFVAHDIERQRALLQKLAWALGWFGLIALIVSVLGGIVIGNETFARVDSLNATLRKVEAGDLGARSADAGREDEFGEVARAMNRMLDRMSALVEGMKEVSDRVAHEMRTPLAHLRTGIDTLRRGTKPADKEALDELVAETDEIIGIFASLLDIATTEAAAGDTRGLRPVAIDPMIEDMIELYEAVAEERDIKLDFTTQSGLWMLGDRPLLVQMLANVIDNAIKFTPQGGHVSLRTLADGEDATIEIDDQGPGLEAGFGDKAFDRFSRGARTAKIPGHGLGLALVRAIAIRHGIKITTANLKPGLRVSLRAATVEAAEPAAVPLRA